MQTFELISTFNYDHLWLEFSNQEQDRAWKTAEECSRESTRWQAYLNALTVNVLLPWLEEMSPENPPRFCQAEETLPEIWEFVNGTAITLGKTRLVLIPQETDDLSEIAVPQEWMDIPSWAADYYLAVQINTEDNWLRCWGYSDYEQIKNHGEYSPISKSYCLENERLQEDLTLLLVTQQFCPYRKPYIPPLQELASSQTEELLTRSSQFITPRLALPFHQWGPLIAQNNLREQLYQRRQPVSLTAWLEKNFQAAIQSGWQDLGSFFANNQLNLHPSLGMRSTPSEAIETLYNSLNPEELKNASQALSRTQPSSSETPQAIAALTYTLETTQDEEARWAAAETLWLLDVNNPMVGIWQGKKIDLGIDIARHSLGLVVAILPKTDHSTSIFLRLYPLAENGTLPVNLKLQILDEAGEIFKEITSRNQDNVIQYKFWGQPGEQFQVSISLGAVKITETFVI